MTWTNSSHHESVALVKTKKRPKSPQNKIINPYVLCFWRDELVPLWFNYLVYNFEKYEENQQEAHWYSPDASDGPNSRTVKIGIENYSSITYYY